MPRRRRTACLRQLPASCLGCLRLPVFLVGQARHTVHLGRHGPAPKHAQNHVGEHNGQHLPHRARTLPRHALRPLLTLHLARPQLPRRQLQRRAAPQGDQGDGAVRRRGPGRGLTAVWEGDDAAVKAGGARDAGARTGQAAEVVPARAARRGGGA